MSDSPNRFRKEDLQRVLRVPQNRRIFVGFDAFEDSICTPVQRRDNARKFSAFEAISSFARAIERAAGQSANFELVQREVRIGGNAANLALALSRWSERVHLAATVGHRGAIEPLFIPLTRACAAVYPLGPSGKTEALEFPDGKLLLGKMGSLLQMSAEDIVEAIGAKALLAQLSACDLFASVNWTMLASATQLWRRLRSLSWPTLKSKRRLMLVDLADPRKRTRADLRSALVELSHWSERFEVILCLNRSECEQVTAASFSERAAQGPRCESPGRLSDLCRAIGIAAVVVHGVDSAEVGTPREAISVAQKPCMAPAISTGGGDHFNAGLCLALLNGAPWPVALAIANATSGSFVRTAKSPTLDDLRSYLKFV